MRWICPHCKKNSVRIRSSRQEHALLRRMWVQCTNLSCSWSGTMSCEYDGEMSPSGIPDSNIKLPQRHRGRKEVHL
ncbi:MULTISPECIES: ogr/Delta-like zinc finger family protein [Moraxella]|uniref:ogr/Delta-like zinc finger family protein n=1 Tax=Moraxella TaxID=475 RepID=UPI0009BEEFC3|nr:Ogr/Delta-like zinc finger [Moraxella catarrhalis]